MRTKLTIASASILLPICALNALNMPQFNGEAPYGYVGSLYVSADALGYTSKMAEAGYLRDTGLWASFGYSDLDFDDDGDRQVDGDFSTASGSLGYTHRFENYTLGVFGTVLTSEFDSDSTQSGQIAKHELDGDGYMLTVFASTEWEGFLFGVEGTVGQIDFDSERKDNFSSLNGAKDADFDTDMYQLELFARYDLLVNEQFTVRPHAKLGYYSAESDSFNETGSASVAQFDSFDDDTAYGELGLTGQYLSLGSFVPYARASVWQDFSDDEVELSGVDEVGNPFGGSNALKDPDIAQTVVLGELGFVWAINDDITMDSSVSYESGDAYDGYGLVLSLDWAF